LNDAFISASLEEEKRAIVRAKANREKPSPIGMLATLTLHLRRDAYDGDGYRIVSDEKNYATKAAQAEDLRSLSIAYERRHRRTVPHAVFLLGQNLTSLNLHNNAITYYPVLMLLFCHPFLICQAPSRSIGQPRELG
jgi:hypothetical protein